MEGITEARIVRVSILLQLRFIDSTTTDSISERAITDRWGRPLMNASVTNIGVIAVRRLIEFTDDRREYAGNRNEDIAGDRRGNQMKEE